MKSDHFATFPPALVEPCIKAGTSERGVCAVCGAPWVRVVEKHKVPRDELPQSDPRYRPNRYKENKYADELREGYECGMYSESTTTGWRPTCTCPPSDPIPATVLDIFCGSGTTGVVARKLGRSFVGLDLSMKYLVENARERLSLDALDAWENGIQDDSNLAGLPMFDIDGGLDV